MNTEFRLPVCEIEERSVLGAILENHAEAYDVAAQHGLVSENFFLQAHRMIYSALAEMGEAGEPIDIITLAGKLRDRNQLSTVGGEARLADLVSGVVYDRKSLASYVKRVRNSSDLRIHRPTNPLPAARVGAKILVRRSAFDHWLENHRLKSLDVGCIVDELVAGVMGSN